ncbi:YcjF family protein [Oricola cellulosilytica]|uniref:TIGR01620 family protein n=1 Tax=Oricola cellulosilytica TaxID=1429082 RepID=A0A4R0P754_9HYPH|nr:TIGR01620 family protein [Oricola cellulosilytica]TCD11784.1 TIGR01620 family protein [Oricola cellulosilytica]
MSEQDRTRRPRAFAVKAPEAPATAAKPKTKPAGSMRKPRAKLPGPSVEMDAEDYFERDGNHADEAVVTAVERKRPRLSFASIAIAAFALFASLAAGLWVDSVVRALFERTPWLGGAGLTLTIVFAAALVAVILREVGALFRLRKVDHLRTAIEEALASTDNRALAHTTRRLIAHMEQNPLTAAGRGVLARQEGEIMDARDRYELAEKELFRSLDRDAFILVMGASKRVSVVTAVSPRAFLDILYVLYENFRLVRRLCELYGGRSGAIGNFRLFRNVIGHLAVTGVASVGDGLVQQVIGHGMASRLSARLGEGVLNGLMTARVGIAAMEICRPAPFHAVRRPRLSSILSVLTSSEPARHEENENL